MTAAITLDGVTKRFGTVTAVDDLNLEFRQDVITGLLGRNGAGKTVTLSLVTAQERPTTGTIRVFGRNPRENASVLARTCFIRDTQRYPDEYRLEHILRLGPVLYGSWDIGLGNLLHHLQAVVYNTLLLAGMLVLEGATGGWFINQPIFGTGLLDHGSWFTFWWFTPLSLLATMAMGASVAAAWLWRGTLGLLLHAATTMAIFMTTLWLISLCWDWARFAAHFNAGWLAGSLALVTVLALTGTAALIRRASVRGS